MIEKRQLFYIFFFNIDMYIIFYEYFNNVRLINVKQVNCNAFWDLFNLEIQKPYKNRIL